MFRGPLKLWFLRTSQSTPSTCKQMCLSQTSRFVNYDNGYDISSDWSFLVEPDFVNQQHFVFSSTQLMWVPPVAVCSAWAVQTGCSTSPWLLAQPWSWAIRCPMLARWSPASWQSPSMARSSALEEAQPQPPCLQCPPQLALPLPPQVPQPQPPSYQAPAQPLLAQDPPVMFRSPTPGQTMFRGNWSSLCQLIFQTSQLFLTLIFL